MTKSKSISSPKLGEAFLQHFFTILAIFGFHNGMMIHSQENHVSSNKQQNFVLMAQSQLMKPRFSCHNLAPDGVFFDFLPIFRHFDDFLTSIFLSILVYVFYLGEVGFKPFKVQNWFFLRENDHEFGTWCQKFVNWKEKMIFSNFFFEITRTCRLTNIFWRH